VNVTNINKLFVLIIAILLTGGLVAGCTPGSAQPRGWSGGVVADGKLFSGSMGGKLVAVATSDGNVLWSATLENSHTGGGGFGCTPSSTAVAIYGTPVVSGDLVYVCGYNGQVYALNSGSGVLRWVYPREGYLQPIVGGAVISQGKVYFGCSDGKVYSLDADTGDEDWEFPTGDKVWTTPTIDGDSLFFGGFDKKLYALDADTGREKWQQPFEAQGALVATPLVYDNVIYMGSFDRYFYAVDATDGSLCWRSEVEAGRWFWAKPVIHNSTVYAPCLDGKIYVLDADSGRVVADAVDLGSPIASSPVLIDNAVIVATEAGKVYSLDTRTNEVELLVDLEGQIHASLCAGDGVVYVHTQDPEALYLLSAQTGVGKWQLPLSSK